MSQVQDRYLQLVKEITALQWVRESLPSHSKYYEGLKKKLEKQQHLKEFSESELKKYRMERDASGPNMTGSLLKTYSQVIESVRFYDNAIVQLQTQMDQAKVMMEELNIEKQKLDGYCDQLHSLFDQLIIPDMEDASYIFEQHLRNDVDQLIKEIPDLKLKIGQHKEAQSKLYQARELIELAMKSLPGASTFMDRQALAPNTSSSFFDKALLQLDPIKKADDIAKQGYQLVLEAHQLCPDDVPNISHQTAKETDVLSLLTEYRGYRLKIEFILRTQLNPRLNSLENGYNKAKFHFEQRTIDWVDHQILLLEAHLRINGCLLDQNLDREISILRMGSRAAIAAVAEETTGRVAVDDALDISTDDMGPLPEYQTDGSTSSSSEASGETLHEVVVPPVVCDLPSYASNHLPPPAYTR